MMLRLCRLLLFFAGGFCLFHAQVALAAEGVEKGIPTAFFVKLFFGLICILSLIVILAAVYRKFGHYQPASKQLLSVENTLTLGHKEKIIILRVADRRVLLSVTPGRIEKLLEIEKDAVLHEIPRIRDGAA